MNRSELIAYRQARYDELRAAEKAFDEKPSFLRMEAISQAKDAWERSKRMELGITPLDIE